MYRRLEKTCESILRTSPEVAKILKRARIIKIGMKEEVSFGQLYELISDPSWPKKLIDIVRKLNPDDFLLLHGFSIVPVIYGRNGLINVLRLLDSTHDDVTIINKCPKNLYDETTKKLLERFHDVVISVKKEGEFLGSEVIYTIGVTQSIVMDIKPGLRRFKIGENMRLAEF